MTMPRGTRPLPFVLGWNVFTDGQFIWYEHDITAQRVDVSLVIVEREPAIYLANVAQAAANRQRLAGAPR